MVLRVYAASPPHSRLSALLLHQSDRPDDARVPSDRDHQSSGWPLRFPEESDIAHAPEECPNGDNATLEPSTASYSRPVRPLTYRIACTSLTPCQGDRKPGTFEHAFRIVQQHFRPVIAQITVSLLLSRTHYLLIVYAGTYLRRT